MDDHFIVERLGDIFTALVQQRELAERQHRERLAAMLILAVVDKEVPKTLEESDIVMSAALSAADRLIELARTV